MKLRTLAALTLLALTTRAQIQIDRIHLFLDYGNTVTGIVEQVEQRKYGGGFEVRINSMFTWEGYYQFDGDGYSPFRYSLGLPAGDAWGNRFNRVYRSGYTGLRLYPAENYHSQALSLRRKKNYGWYFSFGYAFSDYTRREFALETESQPVYDDDGNPYINSDGSIVQQTVVTGFDKFSVGVFQWGQNFGFGWKQYHSKYMYTDFGVYSEAFFRENRKVRNSYTIIQGDGIVPQDYWEEYLEFFNDFTKNGRGFVIRANIGINLDFRR